MMICIITPYYESVLGGITTYVFNLNRYLQLDNDTDVSVISYLSSENTSPFFSSKLIFIPRVFLTLMRKRPQVVHTHSQWFILAPAVFYKIFYRKTVLVHTFHTSASYNMSIFKKMLFERLLSMCNTVTFVSQNLLNEISERIVINCRKEVIYSGVAKKSVTDDEISDLRTTLGLDSSGPVICYIGNFSWDLKSQGVELLIMALKTVVSVHSNAKLLIVGEGEYKKKIVQLVVSLNLEDNVIFLGSLSNVFVPLSICDLYAHISLQEGGVSISILEAMSMGKPVIASKVGGIPELIDNGKNGILVENSQKDISNVVLELLSDKEKMALLGSEGQQTVSTFYDWERIVCEFKIIYGLR